MKVKNAQVDRFLEKWSNENTVATYRTALAKFRDFCGGSTIETDRLNAYVEFLAKRGASLPVIYRAKHLVAHLENYCRGNADAPITRTVVMPYDKKSRPVNSETPYAAIIEAFEKTDAAGIAFTLSKMRDLYNEAYTWVNKSIAPVNWDAASWDKAAERCKTAYDGLRRFKEVLALLDTMMQYKTSEAAE